LVAALVQHFLSLRADRIKREREREDRGAEELRRKLLEEDLGSPTVQKILGVWGDDLEWSDDDAQDVYDRLILAGFSPEKVRMLTESPASYVAIEDLNRLDDQEDEKEDEET